MASVVVNARELARELQIDLVPLAEYSAPRAPTHDLLQRARERLLRLFERGEQDVVENDRLERARRATLEDYIAVPDCRVVSEAIDAAMQDRASDDATARLRLIVLPPCERRDLLRRVADQRGLDVLDPPPREALREGRTVPPAQLDGENVLVIPELERWFLRHRNGLDAVRDLLRDLVRSERRCLIGVNAWAWRYLVVAARADLQLPSPITLQPFDAGRLARWLAELLTEDDGSVDVRAAADGEDIFARDEHGELTHDYLSELAARSRGVPWIAWQLWRRGVRTIPVSDEEDEQRQANGDSDDTGDASGARAHRTAGTTLENHGDRSTLWVTHDAAPRLPVGHERDARLVLQALLIHGDLDPVDLAHVLPAGIGSEQLLQALYRAGFVERDAQRAVYYVQPWAYPSARKSLDTAGFPVGAL